MKLTKAHAASVDYPGEQVRCVHCNGHGLVANWDQPDECRDCGGSGMNWRYPGGALARYYGGPLLGRLALRSTGGE